jgi:hypothetical protein
MDFWDILRTFGTLFCSFGTFSSSFGIMNNEKSGNPDRNASNDHYPR